MTERWSYLCVAPPFFIEGALSGGGYLFSDKSDRSDKSDVSDAQIDK